MAITKVRKSVPVTQDDTSAVDHLRSDAVWQKAAIDLIGHKLSEHPSEAEALSALIAVGRATLEGLVTESALEAGYKELAASLDNEGYRINRTTARRSASRSSD